MKLILFGGSFDPIHKGHMELLQAFSDVIHPDRTVLMPAHVSPFKQGRRVTPGSHRLAMCRLAFQDRDDVLVSGWELNRPGASYTYQTLEMLAAQYPHAEIFLITGADMFLSIDRWRCPPILFRHAVIAAVPRGGSDLAALRAKEEYLHAAGAKTLVLGRTVMTVSSTEIRHNLKSGKSIAGLVPPAVEAYIREHHLYV